VLAQRGLVEDDHVIEAFSADDADHAFHVGSLPGRPWRRKDPLDSHGRDHSTVCYGIRRIETVRQSNCEVERLRRGRVRSLPVAVRRQIERTETVAYTDEIWMAWPSESRGAARPSY
jgi:hypothetical protein